MLFRNFIFVTASIAMFGIAMLQIIEYTHPANAGFKVGERLKEWKLHEAKQACQTNPKTCGLTKQQTVA